MNESLDRNLRSWLERVAAKWDRSLEETASSLADGEIRNRMDEYPRVASALGAEPLHPKEFAGAVQRCWATSGQYDSIHLTVFLAYREPAVRAIELLTLDFPGDRAGAATRIREFIQVAITHGFNKPDQSYDRAGAAQLASVILTARFPARFVDYRRERWRAFGEALDHPAPTSGAHEECILWASELAIAVSATPTYSELWPDSDHRYSHPLWVISGLCWVGPDPGTPKRLPSPPEDLSFPEGAEKARLHFSRERNAALVKAAKEAGRARDPSLPCAVCGFSFATTYGSHGERYIEAHHVVPVAELKEGSRTRVEDLALVCSNCHRMIHTGSRTLAVQELKAILRDPNRLRPK